MPYVYKNVSDNKNERIRKDKMKLKRELLIVMLIIIIDSINAQTSILRISDTDFEQAKFENLDYFRQEIKGTKLIGLGEASHMSGHSITAKIKMVKYLHEQCGFDTLAFESPMYEMSVLNERFKSGNITKEDFLGNISGVWNIREMNELYYYIKETYSSNRPLICIGFDSNCFRDRGIGNIEKNYRKFTERLLLESSSGITLDSIFYNNLHKVIMNAYSFKKLEPKDTVNLHQCFLQIKELINVIEHKDQDYYKFWRQITDNFSAIYRARYTNWRSRDEQMAQNLMYYYQISNSRMIVWAATIHLANDFTSIKKYKRKEISEIMGNILKQELGNRYYSIAFVPYQGKAGMNGALGLMKRRIRTKKYSIEKYINETISENYAFISLRNPETKRMIANNKLIQANMFAASTYKMEIDKVVDGLFYLKNEDLVHTHYE